ncbi:phosphoribosylanthranilate isomerase [Staphylococcus simiae]|uniref:phosphoribosylanthranilate isomerase n=1 Tax=Staphylococcus simiae TaxID=308354 RepID=UPI001A9752F7|nr:phosphoribosylanthranilate isomerase [Staphylococcus simiae]MBO1197779.1 phosphoribosylanthranilate isomerase [Staphylococcus simiae]MBO1200559.1 phosphoribosylanthranilate isomerase [Staphylococcus simiae]MBO1202831.1 phosphoribosylanthranilate isomerase [Staphylococcus simiae]MBO1211403.1 phosphoribosylanthranilate isomerase [Staphylococcus simiae]MBO1229790.1 phosphoribosylanthranilate isomerase [Staphylococcus simiae]
MKLKFCGFQTLQDVKNASALPIDAIGFIHYEKSKRHQTIQQIARLTTLIPKQIDKVVVVVNPDFSTVKQLVSETCINAIQFHGLESLDLITTVKHDFPTLKIIKALPADNSLSDRINKYNDIVDLFIIDTPSNNYGGTGKSYDWAILNSIPTDISYLIAGGIDAQSIDEISKLNLTHQGYDIASGIETNHKKDFIKMTNIVNKVKGDL